MTLRDEANKLVDLLDDAGYQTEASDLRMIVEDKPKTNEQITDPDIDIDFDLNDEDIVRVEKLAEMLERMKHEKQAQHIRKRVETIRRRRRT